MNRYKKLVKLSVCGMEQRQVQSGKPISITATSLTMNGIQFQNMQDWAWII